ncbi:uncharacterized protein LOC122659388 [Telopea speciosissima]|uniref:uncharacterized protein LOC122659388 n=1 Tax=Telopea speciosissima TaxID=54955 RepID=UPI001CC346D6|nr:uncharacterized protein LOC122659388 [Telopea speciosissima]
MCRRCGMHEETIEHILLHCTFAHAVWFDCNLNSLTAPNPNFKLFQFLLNWKGLSSQSKRVFKEITTRCYYVLWYLWASRNDLLFNGKVWSREEVIQAVHKACSTFLEGCSASESHISYSGVDPALAQGSSFPPPPSSYKLNCDASFDPSSERSGVGFLIRDHLGSCCIAVSNPVTFGDILVGEATAIREGLLEAISEGTLSVVVEGNNLSIISYLTKPLKAPDIRVLPILEDIRHIASYLENCNFSYISRTVNSIADCLAKRQFKNPNKNQLQV